MYTVSIVVPTYARSSLFAHFITSILCADRPRSLEFIYVIENGIKGTIEHTCNNYVQYLPIKYLYLSEASAGAARNLGINKCSSDFIIFFDDDVKLDSQTLAAFDSAIQRYGDGFFFGGAVYPNYETKPQDWLLPFLPYSVRGYKPYETETATDGLDFLGGNFAAATKTVKQLGGFDLFGPSALGDGSYGGQETRLLEQLINLDQQGIFLPDASVWHHVPSQNVDPSWALQRRYRNGLSKALTLPKPNRTIYGVPGWLLRDYIKKLSKLLLAYLTGKKKKNIFSAKFQLMYVRGMISHYLKSPNS